MEPTNWKNQLAHWNRASLPFNSAMNSAEVDELELLGIIHIFSFNLKLALKTLTSFYFDQGEPWQEDTHSTVRLAFRRGLIKDGHTWMDMLKSQNEIMQSFDDEIRMKLFTSIIEHYYFALTSLQQTLNGQASHA